MFNTISKVLHGRPAILLVVLLLLCIASRLLTSISYFEDPDSLRFALAVKDYDVASLQPHFPGYPVYVFFVKLVYFLSGSLSFAFAFTGGLSVFLLITAALKFSNRPGISALFVFLMVFFNPLFWLMSNRFMPDLTGLALLAWTLVLFDPAGNDNRRFFLVSGLLAGVRLSYLPFLIYPVILLFITKRLKIGDILWGVCGVLIWFIPLLADTGWNELYKAATAQTEGHFGQWGGSVITDPDSLDRIYSFFHSLFAHGFGLWWPGRSLLTLVPTILLFFIIIRSIIMKKKLPAFPGWIWISVCVYALWAFFFQNILYNPRHLMPLVLVGIVVIAVLMEMELKFLSISFLLFHSSLTTVLAIQHRQPSAIAQAAADLKNITQKEDKIISTEVVNFYLDKMGVKGKKLENSAEEGTYYIIGNFDTGFAADSTWYYYHNPYVNLIWPTIKVSRFEK